MGNRLGSGWVGEWVGEPTVGWAAWGVVVMLVEKQYCKGKIGL